MRGSGIGIHDVRDQLRHRQQDTGVIRPRAHAGRTILDEPPAVLRDVPAEDLAALLRVLERPDR
jgi:hypothetical protein